MQAKDASQGFVGFACATSAYLIWGLSPIFYKTLEAVPPFEILIHRIVWSYIFLVPLLLIFNRWQRFIAIFKTPKTLGILLVTTLLVATNWFVFIWSVNNGFILEASLGYYINPLVNVILGMLFLGERLRRFQKVAVLLAAVGVLYLSVSLGKLPWIALTLAMTFGLYGLIRKVAPVDPLEGLATETFLLFAPAAGYLVFLHHQKTGAFLHMGLDTDLLLAATALMTAVPLLLFTMGTKRLTLITIGFLQYLAPSCNFLLAVVVYKEPFASSQAVTFVLIWSALALFSFDAYNYFRSIGKMPPG